MSVFDLNPSMRAYVKWIGDREVPLFCIDDVYSDPDAVREFAYKMEFPNSQAYYPGRHQPLEDSIDGIGAVRKCMADLVGQAMQKTVPLSGVQTDFSIVTTPEYKLLGTQGQPHIDGVPMLGVIYLNDENYGGTAFLRSRQTNSAKVITASEQEHYDAVTAKRPDGAKASGYVTDSDDDWEAIYTSEGRKNTLVMWPGTVWHSISVKIPPEQGELANKRLTQRVIINQVA